MSLDHDTKFARAILSLLFTRNFVITAIPRRCRPAYGTITMAAESDDDSAPAFHTAPYQPANLLPAARHRDALLYLVETTPVTIVVGQTGSGKTTQIPQFLAQAGWADAGHQIAVTQVRILRV